ERAALSARLRGLAESVGLGRFRHRHSHSTDVHGGPGASRTVAHQARHLPITAILSTCGVGRHSCSEDDPHARMIDRGGINQEIHCLSIRFRATIRAHHAFPIYATHSRSFFPVHYIDDAHSKAPCVRIDHHAAAPSVTKESDEGHPSVSIGPVSV